MTVNPYFTAIPRYNLPTSTPFTRETALSFIERLEDLYVIIREIGDLIGKRDEAYGNLIDDANKAIETALVSIHEAEKNADEDAKEVRASLIILNDALEKLEAAERRMGEIEKEMKTFVPRSSLVINVKDHGVKGDGTTDDTNAVKAILAKTEPGGEYEGRTVYFPHGVYRLTDTIQASHGVTIEMEGVVNDKTLEPVSYFKVDHRGVGVRTFYNSRLINVCVVGDMTNPRGTGILSHGQIDSVGGGAFGFERGWELDQVWYGRIYDWRANYNTTGIYVTRCYNTNIYNARIRAFTKAMKAGTGVNAGQTNQINFHGGAIEGYKVGIQVGGNTQLGLFGTYFEVSVKEGATNINSSAGWSTGILANGVKGFTIHMSGCMCWLENHYRFVDAYGTGARGVVNANGNLFANGGAQTDDSLVTHAYAWATSDVRVNLTGDSWWRANTSKARYTMPNPVVNGASLVAVPFNSMHGDSPSDLVYAGSLAVNASGMGDFVKLPAYREAPSMTTYNKRNTQVGALIYNSSLARVEVWNGAAWVPVAGQ